MRNAIMIAIIASIILVACTGGRVDKEVNVGVDTQARVGIDVSPAEEEENTTENLPPPIPVVPDTSVTLSSGTFNARAHAGSGVVRVVTRGDLLTLELDEFKVDRGPDLHIYLATDESATEYVDLGLLQKFSGYQIYTLPKGVDISSYDHVLIWCQAFGVLFSSAELS